MMYDARIARLETYALFDLQGPQAALSAWAGDAALPPWPAAPNTRSTAGARELCWLGAERWLLRAPIGEEDALLGALRPTEAPEDISIVLVSDTLAFWRITGREACQIMAIADPLDIHPAVFGDTGATWSEAFGQRALIFRVNGGFELAVERSYAPMIEDYFARINS